MKESDWERIDRERLSPLYVSVHATEIELRKQLLGNPRIPDVVEQLRRLGEMGIRTHTQLVVCPGLNDGEHLERSIRDLASLYPAVQTVGVVPVGLTRFRANNHYQIKIPLRPFRPEEAGPVVDQVERLQRQYLGEAGTRFAFLSDEWYLLAGREAPKARDYEEYPQLENGIGMVRQLLEESAKTARKLPAAVERPVRVAVACGEMPAGTLRRALEPVSAVGNVNLSLVVVNNKTLGGNVSCSGLMFGAEVAEALRAYAEGGEEQADVIVLPRRMFDFTGVRTLDEWTVERFQQELGRPVVVAEWTKQVWDAVDRHARGESVYSRTPEIIRLTALG
jgi:putative radical SAM enzyme (TIGR03279 family)